MSSNSLAKDLPTVLDDSHTTFVWLRVPEHQFKCPGPDADRILIWGDAP